jgi:hypothetical protein
MNNNMKLDDPSNLRELIRNWIAEACELKELRFHKDDGVIVAQILGNQQA